MARIFVSHRPEDTGGHALRLQDRLVRRLGPENLVTLHPRDLTPRDIILVLIGPLWTDARDSSGKRRIDDPKDVVRQEIAAALERDALVIPVLVGQAQLPYSQDVPEDVRPLTRRQAVELRDLRWEADVSDLIDLLSRVVNSTLRARAELERRGRVPPSGAAEPERTRPRLEGSDEASGRDIFISYVEEDGATASALAQSLRNEGPSTWMYEEDGVPGVSYLTQVNEAIEGCRAVVLVASAKAVKAHQIIREVEAAHELAKMIIPVRIGLTHEEFRASNRLLRMATGTAVSLAMGDDVEKVAKRIAHALRAGSAHT